jgi:hypothetical protein
LVCWVSVWETYRKRTRISRALALFFLMMVRRPAVS